MDHGLHKLKALNLANFGHGFGLALHIALPNYLDVCHDVESVLAMGANGGKSGDEILT